MKGIKKKIIYLDNNATTHMSEATKDILERYEDAENISSFTPSAKLLKQKVETQTRIVLNKVLGKKQTSNVDKFHILFTSGATESNDAALRMVYDAWLKHKSSKKNCKSHFTILTSDVEHHSFLEAIEDLPHSKVIKVIQEKDGRIDPVKFIENLNGPMGKVNFATCMSANNETGAINNIKRISSACKKAGVFFHCDATQTFGKVPIDYSQCASVSMSFHKTHGPKGIGLLIINKNIFKKMDLTPLFPGTQNNGLRGGTENVGAILAALSGLNQTVITQLQNKSNNQRIAKLVDQFFTRFKEELGIDSFFYTDYLKKSKELNESETGMIIRMSPKDDKHRLTNTMLISFFHPKRYLEGRKVCNIKIRKCLYKEAGIIISIGSTCLTGVKGASHVITSLTDNPAIRCGIVRISLSPTSTTQSDMDTLFSTLVTCLEKQRFFN